MPFTHDEAQAPPSYNGGLFLDLRRCSMFSRLLLSILWVGAACAAQGGVVLNSGRRYIVELDNNPVFGANVHEPLYSALKSRHIGFKVDKEFRSQGLFVGAALTLNASESIAALENVPGVIAVRPIRKFSRPEPITMTPVDLQKADVPLVDSQGSHIMTGVDKLHAEGITGEGIRIAIIDTGVDYLHPALGGGFGPGFKVAGGYDFVGDDYNGSNEPEPDPDPLDQCYGKFRRHGTHVAGIAVADPNNPANISGVAYSATINAYRIFGCSGDSTDDIIVEALLRAVDDEQDILTMSIGQPDGWTEGTTSVVASRIAASGKVVTVAAGNDGGSGAWFTSAPGNGVDVISVGSVDNIVLFIYNATVHGVEHNPVTYYSLSPFSVNGTLPVWATSNNISITDDACNPLPDNTPNLTDYITLIRRGNCTFVQKATNAYAKGAQTILIYDNGTGFGPIDVGNFTEVALIQAADGEFLVEQIAAGAPVALSFPEPDQGGATQYPNPAGGLASAFSSYGPTNDFFFKPAIAAPGGNILSLLPSNKGSYGVASGTSMATPFVAGSAALILSQLGKSVDMRTLLETTARIVPNQNNATVAIPETVAKQGAGLLDVYNAIHGTTNVSPGELLLNDSTYLVPEHTFTVKNVGSVNKEYQLSHVPAGTALTVNAGTIFTNLGYVPLTNDSIAVDLSTYSFNLEPGQSQSVVARFTAPPVNTSTFPLYSGFIQIDALLDNGSNETTHVSYLGLAASLKDKDTLDNTNVTLGYQIPVVLEPSGDAQTTPRNYTFSIVNGTLDFPTIQMRLVFGTPQLRLDLVYADFTLENATTVDTLGLLTEYDWVSRNNENDNLSYFLPFPEPLFDNGTSWAPNQTYKILVRSLRVTGDPSKEADFDSWLSPAIGYYTVNATTST